MCSGLGQFYLLCSPSLLGACSSRTRPDLSVQQELPAWHQGGFSCPVLCPGAYPSAVSTFLGELIKRCARLAQFALHNCLQITWPWGGMQGILSSLCTATLPKFGASGKSLGWLCLASALLGAHVEQAGRRLPVLKSCTWCNIKAGCSWDRQGQLVCWE